MARHGRITAEDQEFVEEWHNIGQYSNAIVRLDARGEEEQEIIFGDRTFMITSAERIITQGKILDAKDDPFLNGSFRPLTVPDSVDIDSNPNALSNEDIFKIFASSDLAFGEWISAIDSPATLDRMLQLAEDADELTMKRYGMLKARHAETHPRKRLTTNDEALAEFIGHKDPSGPGAGGRSSKYRPN